MGIFKGLAIASSGALLLANSAFAANIAVLSNNGESAVAADFNANITQHTFTGINVSAGPPDLATLQGYDAVLLFENGCFSESMSVGNRVAEYANAGSPVVLGTFYNQDRTGSLCGGNWGDLETIDPNTDDGIGTSYDGDTLDAASIVPHDLTAGVTSLWSDSYSGGNEAKSGTVVLALWENLNARGTDDPAIAYRVTGNACVIHIGIFPDYPSYGSYGVDFGGDFHQAWSNAFDYGVAGCEIQQPAPPTPIPTLSEYMLIFLSGLLAIAGIIGFRRDSEYL